ncbi:MAG TPA: mycofactocin biosynthesis peptidyl-dipeptidase MftE [Acidimicrobiales bacterium]|nr:mycofactocin biosynthesis peptidyl-dipeptidase MftE [Acidimicrobiales bacterium]
MSGAALAERSTTDIADRAGRLLVAVPVGACEQHGPHLPLGTDSTVAAALCGALAASRSDVVVAPLIGVGASGEHAGFAGTLSVGTVALAAYLTELIRSARSWASGVVLVTGHGGNVEALERVARVATHEGDRVACFVPSIEGADAHAGHTETSLVLALDAPSVRHNELVTGVTTPLHELADELRRGGVAAVSPTGVLGDPTTASLEEGRDVLARLVADLCDMVERAFGSAP